MSAPYPILFTSAVAAILVAFLALQYDKYLNSEKGHPHAGLDIDKLLIAYGYPIEIHEVITNDGYILTLHRIPHGKNGNEHKTRPPILLNHCLTCAAVDFVNSGEDKSLATLLADNSYDVWLMNARGTTWSRKHISLNPDKDIKAFWNFTVHEIAVYDIPNCIDYVLKTTKHESLYYIGMSQGTASFFMMLSEKPEYNKKIRHMTALAPCLGFKYPIAAVITGLAKSQGIYKILRDYLGYEEYFFQNGFASRLMKRICYKNSWFVKICTVAVSLFIGFNDKELNMDQLPVIFGSTLAGCSSKQIEHYLQMIDHEKFHKFDYGVDVNRIVYQQDEPPLYDISKATVPLSFYYSEGDWIVNPDSVREAIAQLPSTVKDYVVPNKDFNHNDFLYALHVRELVYYHVLEDIKKY